MVFAEVFTRPLPKTLVLRSSKHVARSKIMCNNIVNYNVFLLTNKCQKMLKNRRKARAREESIGGGRGGPQFQ